MFSRRKSTVEPEVRHLIPLVPDRNPAAFAVTNARRPLYSAASLFSCVAARRGHGGHVAQFQ